MVQGRYDLNSIIRWYAYHLSRGESYDGIDIQFYRRYPGFGPVELGLVRQEAIQVRAIAERTAMLLPTSQLRDILSGTAPPGDSTYINARVKIGKKNVRDEDQEIIWREVQWRGSWDTTWHDILDYLDNAANELLRLYATLGLGDIKGLDILSVTIDSSVWFQHPQQQ
jgi:hypothetical protein